MLIDYVGSSTITKGTSWYDCASLLDDISEVVEDVTAEGVT